MNENLYMLDYMKIQISRDLKRIMAEEKKSVLGLSRKTGISRQHLNKILNREANISFKTLARITVALGLDITIKLEKTHG